MFCFFFFLSFLFPQQELVDGVVATVGDKTILFSEVLSETRMLAEQKQISPQNSPLLFQKLFDRILKDKVYLKIVLIEAEKDTLFSVSYDEINSNLNNRIDVFINQVGSEKNLEEAFGMSLGDIKNNYVSHHSNHSTSGYLELERANVDWSLSVDERDLPHKDWKAFRTIKVNGEEVDFSDGFTDLHTKSYEEILGGNGFKLEDAKPALDLVHKIRNYKT